jgi:hypothetical protein
MEEGAVSRVELAQLSWWSKAAHTQGEEDPAPAHPPSLTQDRCHHSSAVVPKQIFSDTDPALPLISDPYNDLDPSRFQKKYHFRKPNFTLDLSSIKIYTILQIIHKM